MNLSVEPPLTALDVDTLLAIMDDLPMILFVKRADDLSYVGINRAAERFLGRSREQVLGRTDEDLFEPVYAAQCRADDLRVLVSGEELELFSEKLESPALGLRFLHTRKRLLGGEPGKPRFIVGVAEDVTEGKMAEESLRLFFEQSLDFLGIAGYDTMVQSMNPALECALGYEPGEANGLSYLDLVHPDDQDKSRKVVLALAEGNDVVSFENRFLKKQGGYIRILWSVASNPDLQMIFVVGRDVTELRRVEDQLVQITENERERIAQDLHDGLGQVLAGIAFKAKLVESMVKAGEMPQPQQVSDVVKLANQASVQASALARGIDPIVLQDGLITALEFLAISTSEVFGVDCTMSFTGDGFEVDKLAAKHLYRIAQEGLTNALKHGKAGRIQLMVVDQPDILTLRVIDDGKVASSPADKPSGMGLRIMNHRAKLLGGELTFRPRPAGGHVLEVVVPRPVILLKEPLIHEEE